jgi:hypothetical protein
MADFAARKLPLASGGSRTITTLRRDESVRPRFWGRILAEMAVIGKKLRHVDSRIQSSHEAIPYCQS